MREAISDTLTGEQVAFVEDGREVFSIGADKQSPKLVATVRDGRLYSLAGEPLNIWLSDLHGSADVSRAAIAGLRKLCEL
jgi:hypothetical protein